MKSKKLLSLLLALAMVMSMAACGAKTNEPPATSGTPSETGAPCYGRTELAHQGDHLDPALEPGRAVLT